MMLPTYIQIEDNHSLVRDTRSMAIINTDQKARQTAKEQRQRILNDRQDASALQTRVANLEQGISDLRGVMLQILEKLNG